MSDKQMIAEINRILNRWKGTAFLQHALTWIFAADKTWADRGREGAA